METLIKKTELESKLSALRAPRSAWGKGVATYAAELIESIESDEIATDELKSTLLNGAKDWSEYSCGGSALIYDADICERLCSPSEIKKTRNGERAPSSRESWLDCQARALGQAARLVSRIAKGGSR